MFRAPIEHSMDEAYVDGDFDIEGNILKAIAIVETIAESSKLSPTELPGFLNLTK